MLSFHGIPYLKNETYIDTHGHVYGGVQELSLPVVQLNPISSSKFQSEDVILWQLW